MVNTITIYVDNKVLVMSSIAHVFLIFVSLILKTYFNTSFIVTRLNVSNVQDIGCVFFSNREQLLLLFFGLLIPPYLISSLLSISLLLLSLTTRLLSFHFIIVLRKGMLSNCDGPFKIQA